MLGWLLAPACIGCSGMGLGQGSAPFCQLWASTSSERLGRGHLCKARKGFAPSYALHALLAANCLHTTTGEEEEEKEEGEGFLLQICLEPFIIVSSCALPQLEMVAAGGLFHSTARQDQFALLRIAEWKKLEAGACPLLRDCGFENSENAVMAPCVWVEEEPLVLSTIGPMVHELMWFGPP